MGAIVRRRHPRRMLRRHRLIRRNDSSTNDRPRRRRWRGRARLRQAAVLLLARIFRHSRRSPGVINLVYLDVWQREVTVFEDDALREPALNGPDTRHARADGVAGQGDAGRRRDELRDAAGRVGRHLTAPVDGAVDRPSDARSRRRRGRASSIRPAATRDSRTVCTASKSTKPARSAAEAAHRRRSSSGRATTRRSLPGSCRRPRSRLTDWIITVSSTGRDSWMRFEVGNHVELLDDDVEFAMRESGTGGIRWRA